MGPLHLFCHLSQSADMTVDPNCPCCEEEPQIVEHWPQRCPKAVELRQQLFGEPPPPSSILTTNPSSVLALARKTLLSGPKVPCLNKTKNISCRLLLGGSSGYTTSLEGMRYVRLVLSLTREKLCVWTAHVNTAVVGVGAGDPEPQWV